MVGMTNTESKAKAAAVAQQLGGFEKTEEALEKEIQRLRRKNVVQLEQVRRLHGVGQTLEMRVLDCQVPCHCERIPDRASTTTAAFRQTCGADRPEAAEIIDRPSLPDTSVQTRAFVVPSGAAFSGFS